MYIQGDDMHATLVRIGNSKGVRIPKAVLEQCGITDSVEMEVLEGQLVLRPRPDQPRQGWREQFGKMAEQGDDRPLISESLEPEMADWEW